VRGGPGLGGPLRCRVTRCFRRGRAAARLVSAFRAETFGEIAASAGAEAGFGKASDWTWQNGRCSRGSIAAFGSRGHCAARLEKKSLQIGYFWDEVFLGLSAWCRGADAHRVGPGLLVGSGGPRRTRQRVNSGEVTGPSWNIERARGWCRAPFSRVSKRGPGRLPREARGIGAGQACCGIPLVACRRQFPVTTRGRRAFPRATALRPRA